MKYQVFIIALVLILPFFISAEVVISNTGSIKSVTTSSASTGGNSVEAGGTVVTGDSSATAKTEVISGGSGTDVRIETSTTVNGETKSQTIEKTLRAGEPVSVEVSSKSVSGQKAESSATVNNEKLSDSNAATVTQETVVRTESQKTSAFISFATKVSLAIKNIFSVFKFW